ncbi:MAG: META domain-containing protein [Candidatus Limnocylindria bacterium]
MPPVFRTPALALVLLLAACGGAGAPSPDPSGEPFDPQGSWRLASGDADGAEVPIVDDHPITLTIEGSQIGGTAACNSYGGRLTMTGGRLEIGDLAMTAMGCEEPIMAAESAYMAALGAVDAIAADGEQLVLSGPGVELRFEALPPPPTAELVETAWTLETVFVGDVASSTIGDPALLILHADGTFNGSTGCRTFSGEWVEQGEQIVAPSWGLDEAECAADVGLQDTHVVSVIGDGFVPSVDGDLLTLTDPGGVGLVYRAGE